MKLFQEKSALRRLASYQLRPVLVLSGFPGIRRHIVFERALAHLRVCDALNEENAQAVFDFMDQPYYPALPKNGSRKDFAQIGPFFCNVVIGQLDARLQELTGQPVKLPVGEIPRSPTYKQGLDGLANHI